MDIESGDECIADDAIATTEQVACFVEMAEHPGAWIFDIYKNCLLLFRKKLSLQSYDDSEQQSRRFYQSWHPGYIWLPVRCPGVLVTTGSAPSSPDYKQSILTS